MPGGVVGTAGAGNDDLFGNLGDDISGGKADDALSGGHGTDSCYGNAHVAGDTADATCEVVFGVP